MGGGTLVQPDQFVDLRAGQGATALDQVVKPGPLGPVCGHEDVGVHAR